GAVVNAKGDIANSAQSNATPPAAYPNSAVFVKVNTTTFFFKNTAYTEIYTLSLHDALPISAYASVGVSGQAFWSWANSTSDGRALQKANSSTDRIAACNYTYSSMTYDLNLTDGQTHQVAYYFLDWDAQGRNQKVEIFDASNN